MRITKEQEDKFFFYFCLIDMMFLPYFFAITMAYSLPIIFIWYFLRRHEIRFEIEARLTKIAIIGIVLSTIVSAVYYPQNISANMTYMVEMITVFLYYIMFLYYIKRYDFLINKWLMLFVLFVMAFALLYNFDRAIYQEIKYIWNPRMATQWYTTTFEGYRFGFIWMDENNIGYVINSVVFFLVLNDKTSLFMKSALLLCNMLVLVSCMSSGGMISFGVTWGLWAIVVCIKWFVNLYRCRKIKIPLYKVKVRSLISVVLLLGVFVFAVQQVPKYVQGDIFQESEEREEENSLDSREAIWERIIENANFTEYLLWGHGGRTMLRGEEIATHNGHFYWIMSYGLPVYLIFMYLYFRKKRTVPITKWLTLFPFFLGFSINTMVGEPKCIAVMALLTVCVFEQEQKVEEALVAKNIMRIE